MLFWSRLLGSNGMVSQYTYNQLSVSSGAIFNSPKFYDFEPNYIAQSRSVSIHAFFKIFILTHYVNISSSVNSSSTNIIDIFIQKVRQDIVSNGIVSQYTYLQLSESSGATFNSPKFYDYNQY